VSARQARAGEHDDRADNAGAEQRLDDAASEQQQHHEREPEQDELPAVQHDRQQDRGAEDGADRRRAGATRARLGATKPRPAWTATAATAAPAPAPAPRIHSGGLWLRNSSESAMMSTTAGAMKPIPPISTPGAPATR